MTKRRTWRESCAVGALALTVRLAVVAWAHERIPPTADGTFYQRLAERLASGEGYTWSWPDGVVTYAAHYPVGYPAILASAYSAFGTSPTVAMSVNALFGALGALAVHRMLSRHGRGAVVAGMLVALHPGLLAYTPALMTEGLAGSLLLLATWTATAASRATCNSRRWRAWLPRGLTGVLLGIATLVRPQLIVLAPVLGWVAVSQGTRRRLLGAALVTTLALGTCLPWTLRNCNRMGRCALVSVNGGWNLLIGTNSEAHGGWAPVVVPRECREVFDEAGKDRCFEGAAVTQIRANPRAWLSLVPGKWRATFDYCGAGGWYLHQANPAAFGEPAKLALGVIETVFERLLVVGALLVSSSAAGRRPRRLGAWAAIVRATGWLGIACAFSPWGFLAHLALAFTLGARAIASAFEPLVTVAFAMLLSTLLIHGAFFGGGRYQVPVLGFIAAIAAAGRLCQRPRRPVIASITSQSGSPTTLV